MKNKAKPTCPHCGSRLLKWLPPAESSWGSNMQYACFNDECSYYIKGWNHMWEKFEQKASYRYRLDPVSGQSGPLPVWSDSAIRNRIVASENEEN